MVSSFSDHSQIVTIYNSKSSRLRCEELRYAINYCAGGQSSKYRIFQLLMICYALPGGELGIRNESYLG